MNVYMDTLVDAAKRAIAAGSYAAVPGAPAAYVVRDDVAAAAAGILATSGHEGITYHATGPASIGQPEIAAAIAKASVSRCRVTAITEANSALVWKRRACPRSSWIPLLDSRLRCAQAPLIW